MSENKVILKKLQGGKFREVDEYLSSLPDEVLQSKLFYIVKELLYESCGVDQDGLKNMMHFYRKDLMKMQRML